VTGGLAGASDFDRDLDRLEAEIRELGQSALASPVDEETSIRLAHRLCQRASLTGRMADADHASRAVDAAIARLGPSPDLHFLKAELDARLHRIQAARRNLAAVPGLRESLPGRRLAADLDFQEGRYDETRQAYESLVRQDRTWDTLARLAHFLWKMGDEAGAEKSYAEAAEELTAKQMRSYSWVELQRGVMDLTRGRHDEARAHYERADRAYSGWWVVEEHRAELLGACGRFEAAAALYEQVAARTLRPEFLQALGEIHALIGERERAQALHEKALTAYLASARRGEVHYYHHLTDFYADVRHDGPEAVRWAAKDLALRRNFSTQAAMAWALYRAGRPTEALGPMRQALASGASDARLFHQAATIHRAAGAAPDGDRYERMARALNPRIEAFHVHR
jgi:tetratricopeptide (TPR) repeat protein